MIWSFIILLIVLILRIGVEQLSLTYDFLLSWITYFDWGLIGTVVIFILFVFVYIRREFKKK